MTTNPGNPKHPRAADHSEFIRRVTAAVSPKVTDTPAPHAPLDPRKRQDKGTSTPGGGFLRGPHN
jgi:hypothetical protein